MQEEECSGLYTAALIAMTEKGQEPDVCPWVEVVIHTMEQYAAGKKKNEALDALAWKELADVC